MTYQEWIDKRNSIKATGQSKEQPVIDATNKGLDKYFEATGEVRNYVGQGMQLVADFESGSGVSSLLTSHANKLWRGLILLNRVISPMPKQEGDGIFGIKGKLVQTQNKHFAVKGSIPLYPNNDIRNWTMKRHFMALNPSSLLEPKDPAIPYPYSNMSPEEALKYRALIRGGNGRKELSRDLTDLAPVPHREVVKRKNRIYILNLYSGTGYSFIELQTVPRNIEVTPSSNWAAINSMGRNNPFRFYTGGDDSISFEISWYAQKDKEEVIQKCKLLESWSRADGYNAAPPVLSIKWGGSKLFKDDDLFILESASYTLSGFQDQARSGRYSHDSLGNRTSDVPSIEDLELYPYYAIQKLTFKRVSSNNRTHREIGNLDMSKNIQGIKLNQEGNINEAI